MLTTICLFININRLVEAIKSECPLCVDNTLSAQYLDREYAAMNGLLFSCDGSYYLSWQEFLDKDETFWFCAAS